MASERGVAEPIARSMRDRDWSTVTAARATCRLWHELLEHEMHRRFAALVSLDGAWPRACAECDKLDPAYRARRRLYSACRRCRAYGEWVARGLAVTTPFRVEQSGVCSCGAVSVRAPPVAPQLLAARVVRTGFVAALRRHMRLPAAGLGPALAAAADACNLDMVEWICEAPCIAVDEHVAGTLRTASRRVLQALSRRFDLRTDPLRTAAIGALDGALTAGRKPVCAVLHRLVEFRPDEVSRALRRLVMDEEDKLPMAEWVAETIGVARDAFDMRLLTWLAGAGRLAALRWLLTDVLIAVEVDAHALLVAAAAGGHLPVVQWLVGCHAAESVHDADCAALRAAIEGREARVVEWLLDARPISWRELGPDAASAQRELSKLVHERASLAWTLMLVRRLGVTEADLSLDLEASEDDWDTESDY